MQILHGNDLKEFEETSVGRKISFQRSERFCFFVRRTGHTQVCAIEIHFVTLVRPRVQPATRFYKVKIVEAREPIVGVVV